MTDRVSPEVTIALESWRVGARELVRRPLMSCTAFAFLVMGALVSDGLFQRWRFLTPEGWAVGLLDGLIRAVVVAAIMASATGYLLAGDRADHPIWRVPRSYKHFLGWSVLISLLWLARYIGFAHTVREHLALMFVWSFAGVIAVAFLALYTLRLLPQVAMGVSWWGAWRGSLGHAKGDLYAFALAGAPLELLNVMVTGVLSRLADWPGAIAAVIWSSAVLLTWSFIAATIACLLYRYRRDLPSSMPEGSAAQPVG